MVECQKTIHPSPYGKRPIVIIAVVVAVAVITAFGVYAWPYHQVQASPTMPSASYWQEAMKDEDRSLLMPTPVPEKLEQVRAVSFRKLYRGNVEKKQIALTFDDGPHPTSTPELLAVLKKYKVKATFFVVGIRAEEHPELVKAEIADGHCIANHTYHHDRLTSLDKANLATEIDACSDVIKKITGQRPLLFRPPGGTFDALVTNMANELGYTTVLWTINTGDFHKPSVATIESRVLSSARNGAIILFHDGVSQTVSALPDIITRLRAQGYEFVTIDDMARGMETHQ